MLKNVTGYTKRAGDHPGTVDCTSKLHSSTLGSRVWGKGNCGLSESPLHMSPQKGLLQSIPGGGGTRMSRGGNQARPKIHIIRVVFQDQVVYVEKRAKLEKRVCFWSNRQILERT